MVEIADYEENLLARLGLFEKDIVVCATNDDEINRNVALMAKKYGVDRVICRLESSNEDAKIKAQGLRCLVII